MYGETDSLYYVCYPSRCFVPYLVDFWCELVLNYLQTKSKRQT